MQNSLNRRSFLKLVSFFSMATTGAIFSCKPKENPATLGLGRIDVHHHILPPDYIAAMKRMEKMWSEGLQFRIGIFITHFM